MECFKKAGEVESQTATDWEMNAKCQNRSKVCGLEGNEKGGNTASRWGYSTFVLTFSP